jgi:hypothetical protein
LGTDRAASNDNHNLKLANRRVAMIVTALEIPACAGKGHSHETPGPDDNGEAIQRHVRQLAAAQIGRHDQGLPMHPKLGFQRFVQQMRRRQQTGPATIERGWRDRGESWGR